MFVKSFQKYPPLGCFAGRDIKQTVAIGVIIGVSTKVASGKTITAAEKTLKKKKL